MTTRFNLLGCLLVSIIWCTECSDPAYWRSKARDELRDALKVKWNMNRAKNVILFIGDGMGPNTVTATRIYKKGEGGRLSFETFPHIGLLKTYSNNKQVPDSASTATALFTGVKVNQETVGVDPSVNMKDCDASLAKSTHLTTLATLAQRAGMSTGIVTTMRVTHATPSAMYAHSPYRKWECESLIPETSKRCKDIARQLVEDEPGRSLNVIMGGGLQALQSNISGRNADPIDTWSCRRKDGRDLIKSWMLDKHQQSLNYAVTMNNHELDNLDIKNTDYLLGIFANGHMQYENERSDGPTGMPSITKMTKVAVSILQKNPKGYFLMVEGGNIDMAHHRGKARKAINEAATMDEAVGKVLKMVDEEDTLVIVTSDHTHTLQINGYPLRGSDIFGIAQASPMDRVNFTTLSYSTGGPGSIQFISHVDKNGKTVVQRRDPSLDDTKSFEYEQQAHILMDENIHGGGDVTIYARGPHSHLFHSVHEQNYVAYAISYAAGLGEFAHYRSGSTCLCSHLALILTLPVLLKYYF